MEKCCVRVYANMHFSTGMEQLLYQMQGLCDTQKDSRTTTLPVVLCVKIYEIYPVLSCI